MLKTHDVQKNIDIFDKLIKIFPDKIYNVLDNLPENVKSNALEIRVRMQRNIIIILNNDYINIDLMILPEDIDAIFKKICNYCIYSFQNQIKNGYITFENGHRIGLAGSAVLENNHVTNIKNISSMNIRIAREFKNCSKEIFEIIKNNINGTLIVGAPMTGKTTILRDLARLFSMEYNQKVVIIDEKYEIASTYNGIPQFDIGLADVLSGFPKNHGTIMALRTLSPDIIICDEIGSEQDYNYIKNILNSGVKIITTIHSYDEIELLNRPQVNYLLKMNIFDTVVFLNSSKKPGEILKIKKASELVC
ncbi:MAG: Flp pilus assembly complex ATPase component TadA [Clostridia bacterium]|nr:Flp pilus assembly complex ATPase component TadA [Clostridia bacterium]